MKTNYPRLNSILLIGLLLSVGGTTNASPLGTAFTYQGRLTDATNAANNLYDMYFALFDVPGDGSPLGPSVNFNGVPVSNGLFTVTLDFGASPFNGDARWLQIHVRTNGGLTTPYTPLSPRQALTPAPYALYAPNAGTAYATAAGVVSNLSLASGAVTSDKIADGTLTAADLSPTLASSTFWRLDGNAGTLPGLHFLGTTDNQPLELKINGQRALRLEPGLNGAPNVVGGSASNGVASGVIGGTIAGGGDSLGAANRIEANYGSIGGGYQNMIQAGGQFSTVGGGYGNTIQTNAWDSFIGGGGGNTIQTSAYLSTIGGGSDHLIQVNAKYATIAGGDHNAIQTDAYRSSIGGGSSNTIRFSSWDSTIGGGRENTIQNNAVGATVSGGYGNGVCGSADYSGMSYSTIAGGYDNHIGYNLESATVSGGSGNTIGDSAFYSVIGGGAGNIIGYNSGDAVVSGGMVNKIGYYADHSAIGGGAFNHIGNNSENATVAGGSVNTIGTNSSYSAIGGGSDNDIGNNAQYAYAAGRRAKANHPGSFVWADSTDADFGSSDNNQFLVRASGGVQLSPGTSIYCGNQVRQMLNLWGTNYGVGVQGSTLYSRTSDGFAWYRGGGHNDAQYNNGGGATLMILNNGGLTVNGTFVSSSDRNLKENFAAVSPREVLDKVTALPISRWNFKGDAATPHVGPMAQDFRAAFALGVDDKHIATVDADGVALAAIQGLNQKLESEVQAKDARIATLEGRLAELERAFKGLAQKGVEQ
jgi:trimeric autotransporter adhesin